MPARAAALRSYGLDDERAAGRRRLLGAQPVGHACRGGAAPIRPFPRPALLGAFEQLDRVTGHDGRYRVLVDELRVAIATQEHAEIIEPGHHALQLDAVHQENREWDLGLADVIEECVL